MPCSLRVGDPAPSAGRELQRHVHRHGRFLQPGRSVAAFASTTAKAHIMHRRHCLATLLALLLVGGCAPSDGDAVAPESDAPLREAAAMLSQDQAVARSARIAQRSPSEGAVDYDLAFELDGELPEFRGRVQAVFELVDAEGDVHLDFVGGTVASVRVNDAELDVEGDGLYNGFFLTLPADALSTGENVVQVAFSHPYSNDGDGLYRFRDPVDGRDYLYTNFEPYNQNRLFPSFDQPDLKARYSTRVSAPADWQVISIVQESSVEEDGKRRHWTFPQSLPVSTYIYALHAGHYHLWEGPDWQGPAGDVPLRLFARQSLAEHVHPEDWFLFTLQGFEFFESYFDIPYPFGKYDQVIVPHFNAGAMENLGAVTFSERFLTRGAVTRSLRRSLANVILHELAHMWFGNLVTMDWWNGLWLNEAFATFMAGEAMAGNTEFTEAPLRGFARSVAAYRADERDTTHPIELPVPTTDDAFANFDAITYSKGSATLSQLNHLVGPEAFRLGVANYLKAHSWGNTTIDDFLGAISASADRDLGPWAEDWLHEPGTNEVSVETACADGVVTAMTLTQTAPEAWPTLRTHRAQLGLVRVGEAGIETEAVPVTYAGESTVIEEAVGLSCPDLVLPNHGNWDFARVRFDRDTLAVVDAHLEQFEPLDRAMLWQSVWDMVTATTITPEEFIHFAISHAGNEPDDYIHRQALGSMQGAVLYLVRLSDDGSIGELGAQVEDWLWQAFTTSEPGSDRQVFLFDSYLSAVTSDQAMERLAAMLETPDIFPDGFTLDQDRRWAVLTVVAGHDHPRTQELLAAETAGDTSDQGRRSALTVNAASPEPEQQRELANSLLSPDSGLTVAEARAIASGLFPVHQKALKLKLAPEAFAHLPQVSANTDPAYFSAVTGGLLGTICDPTYLEMTEAAIATNEALHPALRKSLRDTRFEVKRCLAIGAGR